MKAILSCGLVAFALTLYAADPQDKPTTTATTLSAVPQAQVEDSPLVRAAKRTGRLSKKPTNVITNETLVKSGGHITTAAYQAPLPTAPPKNPASLNQPNAYAERLKREAQEKARKEAIARRAAGRRAEADYNNDSIEPRFEDPAQQEQMMQQGAQTTTAQPPQKPPTL
jgi:hypothetical protein